MSNAPQVGDHITLPSGRVVLVTVAAERNRAWEATQFGGGWRVCRPPESLGSFNVSNFFGGKRSPLDLEKGDALLLAIELNRVVPASMRG